MDKERRFKLGPFALYARTSKPHFGVSRRQYGISVGKFDLLITSLSPTP